MTPLSLLVPSSVLSASRRIAEAAEGSKERYTNYDIRNFILSEVEGTIYKL